MGTPPTEALAPGSPLRITVEALAGVAHRLAWRPQDTPRDAALALRWLQATLADVARYSPTAAGLLDWWLVCALDEAPVQGPWSLARSLPRPLGAELLDILELSSERRLWRIQRPRRFRKAQARISEATRSNPGTVKADKALFSGVLIELRGLLSASQRAAGDHGETGFPRDLRLADATDEELQDIAADDHGGGARRPGPQLPPLEPRGGRAARRPRARAGDP